MSSLNEIWVFIGPFQELFAAIFLAVVTAIILSFFKPRVKLTWGSTSLSVHEFQLTEDGDPVMVATEKLYVQNVGKKSARDIELILSSAPNSYQLWSPREHSRGLMENGNFTIKIPFIAPGELLIVDIVDVNRSGARLIGVNSPDVITSEVKFHALRDYGKVVEGFVLGLAFAGLVGILYGLTLTVAWIL